VAGEQSLESNHAVIVSQLNTTKHSVVDVGQVTLVAVPASDNATIDTRGIAVPDLGVGLRNHLAGVHVDDLNVERQRDTGLVLDNILADELACYPVRSLGRLRSQRAAGIACKQGGWVGSLRSDREVGVMVGVQDVFERASLEQRLVWTS
jgi:hypothetical protein